MQDVRAMSIGEVVDFCIEYNKRHNQDQEEQEAREPKYRIADQNEVNAYFG